VEKIAEKIRTRDVHHSSRSPCRLDRTYCSQIDLTNCITWGQENFTQWFLVNYWHWSSQF